MTPPDRCSGVCGDDDCTGCGPADRDLGILILLVTLTWLVVVYAVVTR